MEYTQGVREQLKAIVEKLLDEVALSYMDIDDGEYWFQMPGVNSSEEDHITLGITIDDDGERYGLFVSWGSFYLPEESADAISQQLTNLLNGINQGESGTSFYLDHMDNAVIVCAEQWHDTFDGLPSKEGLLHRLQDLITSFTDAVPHIQKVLGGKSAVQVLAEMYDLLDDEDDDDLDDEDFEDEDFDEEDLGEDDGDDEDDGDSTVIPFPLS